MLSLVAMPWPNEWDASIKLLCGLLRLWTSCYGGKICRWQSRRWIEQGSGSETPRDLISSPTVPMPDSVAVHIHFADEKVREEYIAPTASVSESEKAEQFQVLTLEALVRMKLTSFRDKDRMHLRDMIEVGLVDSTWPTNLMPELAARLQQLLDDPEG